MTKLGSLRFLEKAKELVIDYFNREVEKTEWNNRRNISNGYFSYRVREIS
mgnify:CR=1 FL=1